MLQLDSNPEILYRFSPYTPVPHIPITPESIAAGGEDIFIVQTEDHPFEMLFLLNSSDILDPTLFSMATTEFSTHQLPEAIRTVACN